MLQHARCVLCSLRLALSWYGIIPTGVKGMAAQESAQAEAAAMRQTVAANRLVAVMRTARVEAAGRRKQRRDQQLIEPDETERRQPHHCLHALPLLRPAKGQTGTLEQLVNGSAHAFPICRRGWSTGDEEQIRTLLLQSGGRRRRRPATPAFCFQFSAILGRAGPLRVFHRQPRRLTDPASHSVTDYRCSDSATHRYS
jgi:hypothetical protein